MSISAPHAPSTDTWKHKLVPGEKGLQSEVGAGYEQWLAWLQSLLNAHSLKLYRFVNHNEQLQMMQLGCLPDGEDGSTVSVHSQIAMRCAKSGTVTRAVSNTEANYSVVCIPDLAGGRGYARHVLAIERRDSPRLDSQTQARLVSWAFKSLEKFSTNQEGLTSDNRLTRWSFSQLDRSGSLASVFAQLMDQLAKESRCERCLIASVRLKKKTVSSAHLLALSGQPEIDRRLPAADSLVLPIESAYRNHVPPLLPDYDPLTDPSMAMETSVRNTPRQCARLIIPVCSSGQWFAIVLERPVNRPFGKTERLNLEQDLGMAVAFLSLSDPKNTGIAAVLMRKIHRIRKYAAESIPRTAAIAVVCGLALLVLLMPSEHRVSAALNVEASERHVLIAPEDGFVKSVSVKAGDSVKKGEVLAALDDIDLQLQQQMLESEVRQNQQAYTKALAFHDRVEVTRLKEEASQMQTELSQLQLQRERMMLIAPVDSIVLSGSWDDSLGAAVSSGDALFTLGSDSSHRLVLDVSEYDVKRVHAGQAVGIRMSADPSNVLAGTVTAIMPLAVATDGSNSVQVHVSLDENAPLRPGMHGLGKILVGRQARLMQWLDRVTSRVVWLGWKLGVLK
ncbi:MAG: efflux RND transporter periplasmic adaptor subunit [Granulosicoccus sp.]